MELQALYAEVAQFFHPQTLVEIFKKARRLITSPSNFFRELPKTGGYTDPIAFLFVMLSIGLVIQFTLSGIGVAELAGKKVHLSPMFLIIGLIGIFIIVWIVTAALFAIWFAMGSRENFYTSFQCVAYLSPVLIINAFVYVPYIGPFIYLANFILVTSLLVIISKKVHGISKMKAGIVFGVIMLLRSLFAITQVLSY